MVNQSTVIDNQPSCPAGGAALKADKSRHSRAPAKNGDISQPLVYAFLLLVEAIDIQSQSTEIKAKQLASNAVSQERLNDDLRDIKWISIPQIVYNNHVIKDTHWVGGGPTPDGGVILHKTYTYKTYKTIANNAAIQQVNAQNQEQNKLRQDLETKMSILQQLAQVGETNVNTDVNEQMKTTEEANALLGLLKELTNKILHKSY